MLSTMSALGLDVVSLWCGLDAIAESLNLDRIWVRIHVLYVSQVEVVTIFDISSAGFRSLLCLPPSTLSKLDKPTGDHIGLCQQKVSIPQLVNCTETTL